ncbi:lytic transglycosylase domain-containing protein [Cupriavidus basilensis]|uniref:Lytic transglycosylase domain-containing protein n=1 Tax=Cupriavidus basilensis TaxID=68895 RepID=A0ABT6B2M4_9BURK|nr:lytic transglycosylase domain-containing protein [Cupriavidus basilensis]MDF3839043.1 lytic transglycosylase domain-containing protein [Cupriavidus basilensis]
MRGPCCIGLALLAAAGAPARADCFEAAGVYHGVNPVILRAIAWQESRFRPDAVNRNANQSVDMGLMQINSIHLPELKRYGVDAKTLYDGCASIYVGAWHLRRKMNKYGNSWAAVGAYHSETPALRDGYAASIVAIIRKWSAQPGGEQWRPPAD